MQNNYINLVIIPQKTSSVIRFRVSQLFIKLALFFSISFGIFSAFIFYDYIHVKSENKEFNLIQKELTLQEVEAKKFENNLYAYKQVLKKYRKFDEKLKTISGMRDFPSSIRFAMGGGDELVDDDFTDPLANENDQDFDKERKLHILRKLKNLEFEGRIREISFFQLEMFLQDRKDKLARIPSIAPTEGYITSPFGIRKDPFTGQSKMHDGLDWANKPFSPIFAPADGTVTATFYNAGFGNFLVINHGYNLSTRYGHLSKYEVEVGQKVKRGDLVARMGNTGRSTGTHLHYEVMLGDKLVDPSIYLLE